MTARVRVTVLAADGAEAVADVPVGERVLDACDEIGAPVRFSCRTASCGVCRVRVLEGAKSFTHPSLEEREVLEIFAASPDERLACQLVVGALPAGDPATIRLQAVEAVAKDNETP